MTPPKPKMDLMRFWPIAGAMFAFAVGYGILQNQVSQTADDVSEIKRTHALEKDLDRHRSLSAHGSVARELGEAKTEIKGLERRLKSLERRFFSNGTRQP